MKRTRLKRWLVLPASLSLLLTGQAAAGFLSTASALPNFHFRGGQIVYDVGDIRFKLADEEGGPVVSEGGPGSTGDGGQTWVDPLRGSVYLDPQQESSGDVARIRVGLFGGVPAASTRTVSERLQDGLDAVVVDTHGDALSYLADDRAVNGPLIGRMQSAGVFVTIPGVNLEVWVAGYQDGAPAQRLLEIEDAVRVGDLPPEALAIPLPGTLLLFLAGVPLLAVLRRSGRWSCADGSDATVRRVCDRSTQAEHPG